MKQVRSKHAMFVRNADTYHRLAGNLHTLHVFHLVHHRHHLYLWAFVHLAVFPSGGNSSKLEVESVPFGGVNTLLHSGSLQQVA
jgi:hypothetical protein